MQRMVVSYSAFTHDFPNLRDIAVTKVDMEEESLQ